MRIRQILFFVFLFLCQITLAQKSKLKFQHLGVEEGLSQTTVLCIFQDSRGFMWFGTRDGLNKYDGYKFTVYKNDPSNPHSLGGNYIKDIVEDKDGNLWIAIGSSGLNFYNRKTGKFKSYKHNPQDPSSISDNVITSLLMDKLGNIWVGTFRGGLEYFDIQQKKFFHHKYDDTDPNSISDNHVKKIIADDQNNLWIGTEGGGLCYFDVSKKVFTRYQHNPNDENTISKNNVWCLLIDSNGNFWVATYGGGLDLMDRKTKKIKHFKHNPKNPNSLGHNVLVAINEDPEGYIYIGAENGGLSILNPSTETFTNYYHQEGNINSLSTDAVNSIYKDAKGNMWIGTYNGPINFVNRDGNKFNHYKYNSSSNSLSNNNVLCIYEDSDNNLWIGTDGGGLNLFERETGNFKQFKNEEGNPNSLCGNYILRVFEDSKKNLWIGTWGDGISVYNKEKKTFKHYKNNPDDSTSLSNNNCWVIYEDKLKNIWVGTFGGGLNLFNRTKDSFIHFRTNSKNPHSISSDHVYNIYEDSKRRLWIGTNEGGLNLLDRETMQFKSYKRHDTKNSISDNNVDCILEDKLGNLWLSTDIGLNYFDTDKETFKVYTTEDGLPNNLINGILPHGDNLWISTYNGLSNFDTKKKTFHNYTIADGLQSNEFKEEAYCKSRSGLLYFGGINGFNEFHPDSVKDRPYDPPIVITDFLIFNKEVPIKSKTNPDSPLEKTITETKEIVLTHKQSVFSLEFASLNYTINQKKKYKYILEGFDNSWNEVGTKRSATYTNLDPGNYTFKVRGLNNEGKWSQQVAEIKITITPPFWKTWWFRAIIGISILGSIVGWYGARINIIKKQKEALEKQVIERTTEVVLQKEEIQAQREEMALLYNEMKDSIMAAKSIQESIIPSDGFIKQYLPESFILYKPKDVVSGDFYWFDVIDDKMIIAVADCTGHGVSGAFMSIGAHHLLNQAIYGNEKIIASEILDRLDEATINEFKKGDTITSNGMDIALCVIEKDKSKLQYAGAINPLYIVRNKELIQVKANRFGIGQQLQGKSKKYTNNEIKLGKGDIYVLRWLCGSNWRY